MEVERGLSTGFGGRQGAELVEGDDDATRGVRGEGCTSLSLLDAGGLLRVATKTNSVAVRLHR